MNKIRRKSLRLPDYDYSQRGAYFVTICCRDKQKIFRNERYADTAWDYIRKYFQIESGDITVAVLLHDHLHLMIEFNEGNKITLGERVKQIKIGIWLAIRGVGFNGKRMWQKNYYEHIIRHERDWIEKVNYMQKNPITKGLINETGKWKYLWFIGMD
ncbi:MAG: transposase [Candidatus Hatepunaea meridiana]|nr:transposase [Candidatus Hatepunaea meridiana]